MMGIDTGSVEAVIIVTKFSKMLKLQKYIHLMVIHSWNLFFFISSVEIFFSLFVFANNGTMKILLDDGLMGNANVLMVINKSSLYD